MKGANLTENHIWKHRTIKGFKQDDLAFLLGQKKPSQISRYERGQVMPQLEKLIKLSYCLGIDIESLYPHLIKKWQNEVDARKRQLEKT